MCQHMAHLRTVEAKLRGELTDRSELAAAAAALAAQAAEHAAAVDAWVAELQVRKTTLRPLLHLSPHLALAEARAAPAAKPPSAASLSRGLCSLYSDEKVANRVGRSLPRPFRDARRFPSTRW